MWVLAVIYMLRGTVSIFRLADEATHVISFDTSGLLIRCCIRLRTNGRC